MEVTLSHGEIQRLVESLNWSIKKVSERQDTPYQVRQENLKVLEDLKAKLLNARRDER
jgi:hypothetical protein